MAVAKAAGVSIVGLQNRNETMIRKSVFLSTVICAVAIATGCSRQPTVPAAEFGESVRSVMNSQIYDFEAAIHSNAGATRTVKAQQFVIARADIIVISRGRFQNH